MVKRVVGCVAAAAAVVALAPAAALADGPFSGSASTTTLSLSIDPGAVLTLPASVLSTLPGPVQSQLTAALQQVTAEVDGAHANATRSSSGADLASGHADVTPVSLQLAPLGQLFTALHDALDSLWGEVSMPALQSTLSDVATITGDSTVMGLLPSSLATELTAFNQQLASLTTDMAGLPDVLTSAVDQLDATLTSALTKGLVADLDAANPNGQNSAAPAITLPPPVTLPPLVPTAPVLAQLAPFSATAVNVAGAQQFGVSGPQASTDEGTSNLAIAPSMDLTSLQTALATLQSVLTQVKASMTTISSQLTGPVLTIIAGALPGGLDLSSLTSQAAAATAPLNELLQLAQSLQLNKLLSCNALGAGSCTITATSVVPQGAGVHAMASSKLVDLSLLQTGSTLASALGTSAGTALLDIQGVQATADTVIDGNNGSQSSSSNLEHIAVAGITVVDNGQIDKASLSGHVPAAVLSALPDSLPGGQTTTIPVSTPAGTLTVYITMGAPQSTYTGTSHRSADLTKMEIALADGAPDGSGVVPDLGLVGAGTIARVDLAAVSSEVLGATLVPTSENGSNVVLSQTGMVGPSGLLVGVGLLLGGFALRRRVVRRERRSAP